MSEISGYPLCWPAGWPRAKSPEWSRFKVSYTDARNGLVEEIRRMGGRQIVLSTNIPLRNDGLPRASYKTPADQGIAVYFTLNGQPKVFACDKWRSIGDNMQSVRKTIEAIRGIERWGSSEIMDRIYRGFQALPEKSTHSDASWWSVLGVSPDSSYDEARRAYRSMAKENHPDIGGNKERFQQINGAFAEAERFFDSNGGRA